MSKIMMIYIIYERTRKINGSSNHIERQKERERENERYESRCISIIYKNLYYLIVDHSEISTAVNLGWSRTDVVSIGECIFI